MTSADLKGPVKIFVRSGFTYSVVDTDAENGVPTPLPVCAKGNKLSETPPKM